MKYKRQVLGTVFIVMVFVNLWISPLTAQDDELQPGLAITTRILAIRAEADQGSDRLTVLQPGELVNILAIEQDWAHITYEDIEGWARIRLLVNVSGPTPIPRGYHQMIYDVESDRVIHFGGFLDGNTPVNDTWSYDVRSNIWTEMAPAQSPRAGEGPLAYDIRSDRAILFLGTIGWPSTSGRSETWAYDINTDTWTNLKPRPAPPSLLGARMVYDAESDRMILFGGIDPNAAGYYYNLSSG